MGQSGGSDDACVVAETGRDYFKPIEEGGRELFTDRLLEWIKKKTARLGDTTPNNNGRRIE